MEHQREQNSKLQEYLTKLSIEDEKHDPPAMGKGMLPSRFRTWV